MLETSENEAAARATVEKSLKEWETTAHNDYMTKSWNYGCAWKTVTLSVADLIACYEVLDLLPMFYDAIDTVQYNVYITDFTFVKE